MRGTAWRSGFDRRRGSIGRSLSNSEAALCLYLDLALPTGTGPATDLSRTLMMPRWLVRRRPFDEGQDQDYDQDQEYEGVQSAGRRADINAGAKRHDGGSRASSPSS